SSRRRHTRSKRDWSSDVCSSDLFLCRVRATSWLKLFMLAYRPRKYSRTAAKRYTPPPANCTSLKVISTWVPRANVTPFSEITRRSEERRVGKEERARSESATCRR